jgi:uncharacterized cupin superfamily protein
MPLQVVELSVKKIDVMSTPVASGSRYPQPFAEPCSNKLRRRLSVAAGLKRIGINLLELGPGAWSSQRHWHTEAEEFVYVLEGEVVLVSNAGEEVLRVGDYAAFLPGDEDGHHLQNRTGRLARVLEVGSANLRGDEGHYPTSTSYPKPRAISAGTEHRTDEECSAPFKRRLHALLDSPARRLYHRWALFRRTLAFRQLFCRCMLQWCLSCQRDVPNSRSCSGSHRATGGHRPRQTKPFLAVRLHSLHRVRSRTHSRRFQ